MGRPPLHRNALTFKPTTIKFLCSYGGKILPRYPDGKLRYHGGETRLLSVNRSISFPELLLKFGELCGCGTSISGVTFRCQLPREDLDALVSITSGEDLANLIEEYDRAASSFKIRAFLSPPKISSPSSSIASFSSSSVPHRCFRQMSLPNASYLHRSASAVPLSVCIVQGNSTSTHMFIHYDKTNSSTRGTRYPNESSIQFNHILSLQFTKGKFSTQRKANTM